MKKQRIQLVLLLVILLALGAGLFAIRRYNEVQAQKPVETEEKDTVIEGSPEDIVRFSYDYEGERYVFEKEDGTWYVEGDHSMEVTQYYITAMLSGIMPLVVEQTLEDVSDFSQYGLEEPQRNITLETEEGSYVLWVGDSNAITNMRYVRVNSGTDVYTLSQTLITRFDRSLDDIVTVPDDEEENPDGDEQPDGEE